MEKVNIKDLFNKKQMKMLAEFGLVDELGHPVQKGDATEQEWIDWFNEYLPKRYKAESGRVIDYDGNLSDQIDIIIYDTHFSPIVFQVKNEKYFSAESVYAVFEVKQKLNKEFIEYASAKIESVRKLKRTNGQIRTINGYANGHSLFDIIGGLLTLRSGWTNETTLTNIEKHVKELTQQNDIDFICCLGVVACEIIYGEVPKFEGKPVFDLRELTIHSNDENGTLIYTYFKLLRMLQKCGNCPAIEFDKYGIED